MTIETIGRGEGKYPKHGMLMSGEKLGKKLRPESPHETMQRLDQEGTSYVVNLVLKGRDLWWGGDVYHHSDRWLCTTNSSGQVWVAMDAIEQIEIVEI